MSDGLNDNASPRRPVFHERRTYRQRRVMDAARVLPLVGLALWLVPLLWPLEGEHRVASSDALLYVFGFWCALIGLSALLSFSLKDAPDDTGSDHE